EDVEHGDRRQRQHRVECLAEELHRRSFARRTPGGRAPSCMLRHCVDRARASGGIYCQPASGGGGRMSIYTEINDVLDHMFNACTTAQISEFIPEKRGFRIHGHSTTVSLERAFWNVL